MKFKNKMQSRAALLKAGSVNEEERSAVFCISSESLDTYDTVFLTNGWELARYETNPVVTYQHRDHDADPDLVIGTSEVWTDQESRQLLAKIYFEDGDDNKLAEKVFRKVKNGILRGASIWANVLEGRWGEEKAGENPETLYFTKQELRSWSIVTVNSNPDALARNAQGIDELKKEIPKTIEKREEEAPETPKKTLSRFAAQLTINKNVL